MGSFDDSEPPMCHPLPSASVLDHFSALSDPRQRWRVLYPLPEILLLVLCATLSGMEDFVEIRLWGEQRIDFLRRLLPFDRGLPAHDTLNDVVNALDAELFKTLFANWVGSLREAAPDLIAIDGKTSRRTHARAKGREPLHLVSAWAARQRLVLGQEAVDRKSNEIVAIPLLLERLELAGALVTIDAMGTQVEIAQKIVAGGGDYLLALKSNRPALHEDVAVFFDNPPSDMLETPHTTTDADHGRIEQRRHTVCHHVDWLFSDRRYADEPRFPHLAMIGVVESRIERNGAVAAERRYYLSSAKLDGKTFAAAVRAHWGVENRLHWVLDVVFHDDLSRDSALGQRMGEALAVAIGDGAMDGVVERGGVGEGLVGEMMRLEVAPHRFDVVEFGRVFRQPFDGQPVRPGSESGEGELAGMDRTIVLDQHDRLGLASGLRAVETVDLLEMDDEVAAALGRAGMDDELAREVIERPQNRDLLGLPRRGHAQVRPRLRPGAGEIGMGQRLALVAVEKNDVARLGLLFAQVQAQAHAFHLALRLTSFQRVAGPPPAELFFRKALDSCERLMRTPSRASISTRRRGIVQLRRSATGAWSKGTATRKAASLFTGGGPGAILVFSAATPPAAKSQRHWRTVSSRTPNASAMSGLVQPASVKSTARARSASPRSRELASAKRSSR